MLGLFYGLRGRDSSGPAPRLQHCFGPPDGVHLRERPPLYRVFLSTSLHKRKAPLLGLFYGLRGRDSSGLAPRPQHCFGPPDGVHLRERTPLYRVFLSTSLHEKKALCSGFFMAERKGFEPPIPLPAYMISSHAHSTSSATSPHYGPRVSPLLS